MNRIPTFSTNGHTPATSLRQLREQAAAMGVGGVGEMASKYTLIEAMNAKRAEIETLRADCQRAGLPTDGDEAALRLRLASLLPGTVGRDLRTLYRRMGIASIILAVAGLAVSLPHLASGLQRITGVEMIYAVLLAIIIDLGFASLKVIDTLAATFQLTGLIRGVVWSLLVACLAFSATVNASEFLRTADSPLMAWTTSGFLAAFIFSMAMIGSALLTRCEPRKAPDAVRPSVVFRNAADNFDRLDRLADTF